MSISRKDDRHNEDLVDEIAEGFNRAMSATSPAQRDDAEDQSDGEHVAEAPRGAPRFIVTGDQRDSQDQHR